jgi:4-hydroxyacetophenone monooxygenase
VDLRASAGLPFDDDLDTIATLLEDVSLPALLLSMVHMTGDLGLLTGLYRPRDGGMLAVQGGLPDEVQAALRAEALQVISAYRDGGYRLPQPPGPDDALVMMRALVAADLGAEYTDFVYDELHIDGRDPGQAPFEATAGERAELSVVVIGCGESGLLAGIRLQEAGIPFMIVEKNTDVGGTWFENRYPGCRVDIPNHFYSYSFEASDHWTHWFSEQPAIEAYLRDVMERHDIRRHVRWSTEVVAADWDEVTASWQVEVRTPDGSSNVLHARALISAVGQLNRPMIPGIDGAETFAGPAFHTARWDESVDLSEARVAIIGAGASGFQLVPAIAARTGSIAVYQRTPQWMAPNAEYHAEVGPGVQWAVRHLPFYARWYRLLLAYQVSDGARIAGQIDPEWDGKGLSVSELNDLSRQYFTQWLAEQVHDPDLLDKVVPRYPPFGKRMLQDNGSWLASLQRDNVELVTDPIDHIESDAVVTVDGVRRQADVLVWATGFRVSDVLWPMHITGRGGRTLEDVWNDRPAAHLGITVPDFPNFFMFYGPGTNAANGSSLIWLSECQMRYILGCLDLLASGHVSLEVRKDVHDEYFQATQNELLTMVWSHPAVSSYYKSADGRIYTVMPWRNIDYWHWTQTPNPDDLVLEKTESP